MPKRTVFHVGAHKTGTTTLQKFAAHNRVALRDKNVFYPGYKIIDRPRHYAHHDFTHVVSAAWSKKLNEGDDTRLVEAILQNSKPDDTVFMSAEPAYRHLIGDPETFPDIWDRRDAFVRRFASVLEPLNPEICIVFRRRDDFAKSLYQEKVKAADFTGSFRDFLAHDYWYFDYKKQYELFKKYFKSVRVLIFEDLADFGTDLVSGFYRILGMDVSGLPVPASTNFGFTPELVELKRLMNAAASTKKQTRNARTLLEDFMAQPEYSSPYAKSFWMNEEDTQQFLDYYKQDDDFLLTKLPYKPTRETLFPERKEVSSVFSGLENIELTKLMLDLLEFQGRSAGEQNQPGQAEPTWSTT